MIANNNKIFFTGGNGFIGKEVIPLLRKDGYKVVAPSSSELNLTDNTSVRKYFDEHGFDYHAIVHAAVIGGRRITEDGLITYLDNMRIFENIFAYYKYVDRFINIDSGASLFDSGQIPLDPSTMELVEGIENQINQVFENINQILKADGMDFSNVVKLSVLLEDLSNFEKVNEIMANIFSKPYPARAAYEVSKLPKGSSVEIETIAFKE